MSTKLTSEELVTRYISQVSRRLPRKDRDDVTRELNSLLRETLEARADEVGRTLSPTATAIVLKEFGSPDEISKQYSPRPQYLIGPKLFPVFLLTVKAVVGGAFGLAGLVTAVSVIFGQAANPWSVAGSFAEIFLHLVYSLLTAAVVVFAILERFGPEEIKEFSGADWDPFELPESDERQEISIFSTYFNIYGVIVLMLWFNFFPDWVGLLIIQGDSGTRFVTLAQMGITLPLIFINLWWLADLGLNLLLIKRGRWTRDTHWFRAGLGLAGAAIFGFILSEVLVAVRSEAFAAAVGNEALGRIFSMGLPITCGIIIVASIGGAAVRIYRILRPQTQLAE